MPPKNKVTKSKISSTQEIPQEVLQEEIILPSFEELPESTKFSYANLMNWAYGDFDSRRSSVAVTDLLALMEGKVKDFNKEYEDFKTNPKSIYYKNFYDKIKGLSERRINIKGKENPEGQENLVFVEMALTSKIIKGEKTPRIKTFDANNEKYGVLIKPKTKEHDGEIVLFKRGENGAFQADHSKDLSFIYAAMNKHMERKSRDSGVAAAKPNVIKKPSIKHLDKHQLIQAILNLVKENLLRLDVKEEGEGYRFDFNGYNFSYNKNNSLSDAETQKNVPVFINKKQISDFDVKELDGIYTSLKLKIDNAKNVQKKIIDLVEGKSARFFLNSRKRNQDNVLYISFNSEVDKNPLNLIVVKQGEEAHIYSRPTSPHQPPKLLSDENLVQVLQKLEVKATEVKKNQYFNKVESELEKILPPASEVLRIMPKISEELKKNAESEDQELGVGDVPLSPFNFASRPPSAQRPVSPDNSEIKSNFSEILELWEKLNQNQIAENFEAEKEKSNLMRQNEKRAQSNHRRKMLEEKRQRKEVGKKEKKDEKEIDKALEDGLEQLYEITPQEAVASLVRMENPTRDLLQEEESEARSEIANQFNQINQIKKINAEELQARQNIYSQAVMEVEINSEEIRRVIAEISEKEMRSKLKEDFLQTKHQKELEEFEKTHAQSRGVEQQKHLKQHLKEIQNLIVEVANTFSEEDLKKSTNEIDIVKEAVVGAEGAKVEEEEPKLQIEENKEQLAQAQFQENIRKINILESALRAGIEHNFEEGWANIESEAEKNIDAINERLEKRSEILKKSEEMVKREYPAESEERFTLETLKLVSEENPGRKEIEGEFQGEIKQLNIIHQVKSYLNDVKVNPDESVEELKKLQKEIDSQIGNPNPTKAYRGVGLKASLEAEGEIKGLRINEIFAPEVKRFNHASGNAANDNLAGKIITEIFLEDEWQSIASVINLEQGKEKIAACFHGKGEVKFKTHDNVEYSCDNSKNKSAIFVPNNQEKSSYSSLTSVVNKVENPKDFNKILSSIINPSPDVQHAEAFQLINSLSRSR